MLNLVHPDVVLDDVDEVIDEPNFNNHNTSPEPPSPYADLEKKYRKNRFNKNRSKPSSDLFGAGKHPVSKSADGNKLQKRKPKKKTFSKVSRVTSGKRNP